MAKRTAIIDLGSNGVRIAIYERTSRYGFYILHEQKIKFRLSENCLPGGLIAHSQILKLLEIIRYYKEICEQFSVRKIQAIGTSSLRDAANSAAICRQISKHCGVNIKVLSGCEEANLSAFGAINLLWPIPRAICLDIGGGSAELALCENGRVVTSFSLNLGTVRLKELYESDYKACCELIKTACASIPAEFRCENLIAIGGSLRAISSALIAAKAYPLAVHGYSYALSDAQGFIKQLYKGGELSGIKKDRYDTIRTGALVFAKIAATLGVREVITSGAGVREGVFLRGIFAKAERAFSGFCPSLRSLEDRFGRKNPALLRNSKRLFCALAPLHLLGAQHAQSLAICLRISSCGRTLSFYNQAEHAAYFVKAGLNFCISHEQKAQIACVLALGGKKPQRVKPAASKQSARNIFHPSAGFSGLKSSFIEELGALLRKDSSQNAELARLLGDEGAIIWLNFMHALSLALQAGCAKTRAAKACRLASRLALEQMDEFEQLAWQLRAKSADEFLLLECDKSAAAQELSEQFVRNCGGVGGGVASGEADARSAASDEGGVGGSVGGGVASDEGGVGEADVASGEALKNSANLRAQALISQAQSDGKSHILSICLRGYNPLAAEQLRKIYLPPNLLICLNSQAL